jgi:hypothetical protein
MYTDNRWLTYLYNARVTIVLFWTDIILNSSRGLKICNYTLANQRSFQRKTNVSSYTCAASGSEQSPFSLLYRFLLVLLWSFDLLWGHDLPVSRILRQLSIYKVKIWAPRPIPNLRATVSLFVRHLAQNLTGMGGLTSNQAAAGNFIELRLIFGGPQCGTSCVSPSWRLEYWGSFYILWETRAPLL